MQDIKVTPQAVYNSKRKGRRNKLKGERDRKKLEKEKPLVFGMIQRSGKVIIHMLLNVKQKTIKPLIQSTVMKGSMVYSDDYSIYDKLTDWNYLCI